MNKFAAYYFSEEKIKEMSDYVHLNFRLILTKMISEMRRKLNIEPSHSNEEGYWDLMYSLQGRMFNEMVYNMCTFCQSKSIKLQDMIPQATVILLLDLLQGRNPLEGKLREDVVPLEEFNKYYMKEIHAIRSCVEALPK